MAGSGGAAGSAPSVDDGVNPGAAPITRLSEEPGTALLEVVSVKLIPPPGELRAKGDGGE